MKPELARKRLSEIIERRNKTSRTFELKKKREITQALETAISKIEGAKLVLKDYFLVREPSGCWLWKKQVSLA